MKKINKKGFTLVELLAVTIILLIIVFLAFTKIKGSTQKSKKNAVKANAISYIKAVNDFLSVDSLTNPRFKNAFLSDATISNLGIKLSGENPSRSYIFVNNFEVNIACIEYGSYYVLYQDSNYSDVKRGKCENEGIISDGMDETIYQFSYTGDVQIFEAPQDGTYKIELWGSQGANSASTGKGGKGAYTSGNIELAAGDILYIYIGSQGIQFNGGGNYATNTNYAAGGGATDVRLVSGNWNDSVSLASRIMIAGGGGGGATSINGGVGGTFVGGAGTTTSSVDHGGKGGTQTSGGAGGAGSHTAGAAGTFGKGANGVAYQSGGGGGYYGGGSSGVNNNSNGSGGGGSSYISGHTGCVAIESDVNIIPKSGCEDGTTDNSCSIHYSLKKFSKTVMKSGADEMPTYDGKSTMVGNSGHGHAKVSLT